MNSTRQIRGGALVGYLAIAINVVAGLLYTPWMISVLGNSDYGLYTLATSLISIFMFDFGMSTAVSRFVAREHVAGNEEGVCRILGTFYRLYLLVDLVIVVVLVSVYSFLGAIYTGLTPGELEKLRVIFIIVGIYNVVAFPATPLSGVLTAYERLIPLKLCDIFNKLFSIVCIVGALLLGGGLYALVLLTALSGLLTTGIKYLMVRKGTSAKADFLHKDKALRGELLGFSVWTTIISLAQRFIFNIAPSVLGAVASTTAVAVFGVAGTIEGYVYTIASVLNGLFIARVAGNSIKGGKEGRDAQLALMCRVGRVQFVIVGLVFSVFTVMGGEFVDLWVGDDYRGAYIGAVALLFPLLFSSSQQIAETVVSMENKVKQQSVVFVIMAAVNIVLIIPLSQVFGAVGAAISIGISYCVRTVLMNVVYVRELKLDMRSFYKACYTELWLPIAAALLIGVFLNFLFPGSTWVGFLVKSSIVCFVYAGVLAPLLNQSEKRLFGSILVRRKSHN